MLQEILKDETQSAMLYLSLALLGMVILYIVIDRTLRTMGKSTKYLLPSGTVRKVASPLILLLFALIVRMEALRSLLNLEDYSWHFRKAGTLIFIFAFTWLVIRILRVVKRVIIDQYDVGESDNLKARKVYTQFTILERIIIFIIIILALGLALMSFEGIRRIGISVFASAGVAGIIIGFSAQKLIATILAGIQIAITQPIRLDDVVIVEGEWGRIEEITLTYVTIAIWDKRRLVVPTTYFIEKPFQNWTKNSSDILGTVFIYTDFTVPVDAIREELEKTVKKTELWDGELAIVQVTNMSAQGVEIRALVSAADASQAWDLRVLVREKLIDFLQREYPESLARTRILMQGKDGDKE